MSAFVKTLNLFYAANKPLYEIEDGWSGFEWLVVDDRASNLLAFNRYSLDGECITAVINFSGVDLHGYGIGVDEGALPRGIEYRQQGFRRQRQLREENI